MRTYLALLRRPGAARPFASALLGRLTPGMVALALVLSVRASGGSYATAGLVTAAHATGVGLAAPLLGRLADRHGQRAVLVPAALAYGSLTVLLAVVIALLPPTPVLVVLAAAAGTTFPPLSPCARVLWSRLFPDPHEREAAFALDSVAVEAGFMLGPLATVAVIEIAGATAGLVAAGLAAATGTLAFASSPASRGLVREPQGDGRGGALRSVGVRTIVLAFALASLAFGVLEVTIPALAEAAGNRAAAGPMFSALAGGSLLGGLLYGSRPWPGTVSLRFRILLLSFAAGLALVPLASGLVATGLAMFVAGSALAPTVICAFQLIDDLALPGTTTEALTWTTSANVAGIALGAAAAGWLVDRVGPSAGLWLGVSGVTVAAVLGMARGRVITPAPRVADAAS